MQYFRPKNLEQLRQALSELEYPTIVAGGTDLMVEWRQPKAAFPQDVIDLDQIKDFKGIKKNGERISIGAMTTHEEIVNNELIQKHTSLLASACNKIGSQQIRNRGTIGGNICNASPCADSLPSLFALQAELKIINDSSERMIPLSDFIRAPYKTTVASNEIVSQVEFKIPGSDWKSAFYKLGRRNALAIARLSVAVLIKINKNFTIEDVRIVPGSVFPVWKSVVEAQDYLIGKSANLKHFTEAGKIVASEMIKISGRRWSTPYKEPVIAALVKRTLMMAAGLDWISQ